MHYNEGAASHSEAEAGPSALSSESALRSAGELASADGWPASNNTNTTTATTTITTTTTTNNNNNKSPSSPHSNHSGHTFVIFNTLWMKYQGKK